MIIETGTCRSFLQRDVEADSYLECHDLLSLQEEEHVLPVERGFLPVHIQRATGEVSHFMSHLVVFRLTISTLKGEKTSNWLLIIAITVVFGNAAIFHHYCVSLSTFSFKNFINLAHKSLE